MEEGSQKDLFHRRWQKAPSKQDDEKLKVLAGQQGSLMDKHITHEDSLHPFIRSVGVNQGRTALFANLLCLASLNPLSCLFS